MISLSDLQKYGIAFQSPEKILRVYNYKIEKIRRINERAVYGMTERHRLYEKGYANMTSAEIFGIDLDTTINNPFNCDIQLTLRDYQIKPLTELLKKPYGILGAMTWFWKSFSVAWIINELKCKTVILCNTQINAEQMSDRLISQFWEENVWMFYWPKKEFKNITVVVYNSYKKFLEMYNGKRDLTLFDEAHKLVSDEYRKQTIFTKSQYKYWMTGTPYWDVFKKEDFKLRRGRIIEASDYKDMLLSKFNFNFFWVSSWMEEVKEYRDYHHLKQIIEENETRLETIKKLIKLGLNGGHKILVMTDRVELTQQLGEQLNCPRITGWVSAKKRKIMFDRFEQEKVLIAPNQIVWEWYDNPEVDMIIVAFSWRTQPRLVQAIWRSVRIFEWKKDLYIYDIVDNAGIMKNQFRERKQVYQQYTSKISFLKPEDIDANKQNI